MNGRISSAILYNKTSDNSCLVFESKNDKEKWWQFSGFDFVLPVPDGNVDTLCFTGISLNILKEINEDHHTHIHTYMHAHTSVFKLFS